MAKPDMDFKVGDQVIHHVYGPGVIIQLDEKEISGHTDLYYVVETRDLTLWVPVNEVKAGCLRYPTPAKDFPDLFHLLKSPAEPLSSDRFTRRTELSKRLKDGSIISICLVIRDLMPLKRIKKMNDHDNAVFGNARNLLLSEWSISLSVPIQQAEITLDNILAIN